MKQLSIIRRVLVRACLLLKELMYHNVRMILFTMEDQPFGVRISLACLIMTEIADEPQHSKVAQLETFMGMFGEGEKLLYP